MRNNRYKQSNVTLVVFLHCSNQTAWRKANLACKQAIDNMEKDELLHSREDQSPRQRFAQYFSSEFRADVSMPFQKGKI